jgi:hypothetical protein
MYFVFLFPFFDERDVIAKLLLIYVLEKWKPFLFSERKDIFERGSIPRSWLP